MSGYCDLILKNVSVPSGIVVDISIKDGIVVHSGSSGRAGEIIDCKGLCVLPGAIDMHVHMRGGKEQSSKETWETGTKSALAGGVTHVVDQPNCIPPVTDAFSFESRLAEAKEQAFCNFSINASVMEGADLPGMHRAGAAAFGEIFAAPSSYGEGVPEKFLRQAFREIEKIGGLATVHAETVTEGIDDSLSAHNRLRSPEGEALEVSKVIEIAPENLRLHFCHLSCPESVNLVSGKNTFEVMPHHLLLSTGMFDDLDTFAKVNPPVRDEETRHELWRYWDRIDVLASDHAPHTIADKSAEFSCAPSGIPGVGTMIPLFLALVYRKKISIQSLIDKTTVNPARILHMNCAGFEPGMRGDFTIYPKTAEIIDPERLHSLAGWTPYEGMEGVFPEKTILGGDVVYSDGEFFRGNPRWIPGDGYIE
ncbi:dihydroorotase, multifunctional complex type [Methanolacinia petrolearia DSM 11571]|uniref:Dihydroorotase, multifunctional complex type n=1 Tax=Methanolacinia petrolearia (strain DSM 11571 / OCM 486 / SEBR 4847) TaxID=679926 RepID=E1REA2_METP4|nr:dihydroorotase [Methanolacinia petrolearia]ADN36065.1 dihydroorotase, multifunctional complex type [Methanolacinia petrolearia DSM 11571]